jgi:DNA-directed RNA polymerase subunit RPC12/RpoP
MSIYILVDEDTNTYTYECSDCRHTQTFSKKALVNNHINSCPVCGSKITEKKIETIEELIEGM